MTDPNMYVIVPQRPTPEDASPQGLPVPYAMFVQRLFKKEAFPLQKLHAAIGVTEEAGELAGCIKKNVVYNKPLHAIMKEDGKTLIEHIEEECGDVLFYLQAICNLYGMTIPGLLQANAEKLALRYSDLCYSDEQANLRNDKPMQGA